MTTEMIKEFGTVMATKMAIVGFTQDDERFKGNKRMNPFFSELKGMEQALKIMGIDFEYEFNADVTKATAIVINGMKFEI